MRADLASMWSPRNRVGYSRRISTKVSSPPLDERNSTSDDESFTTFDEHVLSMKVCILLKNKNCFYIFVISLKHWITFRFKLLILYECDVMILIPIISLKLFGLHA